MRHINEYISQTLNPLVLEVTFTKSDWEKHEYKYINAVLDDIIAGNPIRLGKDGEDGNLQLPTKDEDVVAWAEEFKARPNKDIEEFNDFFDNYSSKAQPWNLIFKGYYSGKEKTISTKDQETATCSVWNWFNGRKADGSPVGEIVDIGDDPSELYGKDGLTEAGVNTLTGALDAGKKFDKGWINTFNLQIEALVATLDKVGVDKTKYIASRVDNGTTEVEKEYTKFLNSYATHMGTTYNTSTKKDAYCTADIILYDYEKASDIISKLQSAQSLIKTDIEGAVEIFRDLAVNNEVIGLSLKKLSKSCIVEKFNYDGPKTIRTNSVELEYTSPGGGGTRGKKATNYCLYIHCKGNYNFKYWGEDEHGKPVEMDGLKDLWVVLRSFGDFNVAMDVKTSKGGISLGKVPIDTWTKLYHGVCQHIAQNKKKAVGGFEKVYKDAGIESEYVPSESAALQYSHLCAFLGQNVFDDKNVIDSLINAGIKSGTNCLPFILMH